MKTTIYNINTTHGDFKILLFVEGNNQVAHIYKGEQLVRKFKYEKDQDINIDLVDVIKNDLLQNKS